MTRRQKLGEELHDLLRTNGYPENVYFQSPSTVSMRYPCIRYALSKIPAHYADNIRYMSKEQYILTVIDPNPDSQIPYLLLEHFDMIDFDRPYTAENLNHFVLTLFY